MGLLRGAPIYPESGGAGTSPKGARLGLMRLVARQVAGTSEPQTGVILDSIANGGPVVVGNADTSPMSYTVHAAGFVCALTGNGAVALASDADAKASTTAAPSSNSRIDVIWVQHPLIAGDGGTGTSNQPIFGVTQGTAAASPVAPAIPTGATALAQAVMPSSATSTAGLTITPVHAWTTASGGLRPISLGSRFFKVSLGNGEATIQAGLDLNGASSAVKGALFIKAGVTDATTNGSGDFACVYDAAFPTNTMWGICTDMRSDMSGIAHYRFNNDARSGGQLNGRAYNASGSPLASFGVRVGWLAIGY